MRKSDFNRVIIYIGSYTHPALLRRILCYNIEVNISSSMGFITNINWASPSWDLFIILLFFVGAFLYGLSLGRDRILVILTSIYMALAIVNTAPYLTTTELGININGGSFFKVTVFLGIFLILFFLVSRSAVSSFAGDSRGRWWHSIVFSFFHIGLMLSIVLKYLPNDILNNISEPMRYYLISDPARFFWLVAPIVVMALTGGKDDDRK